MRQIDALAYWTEARALAERNAAALLPILGLFVFLPAAMVATFIPPPPNAETLAEAIAANQAYQAAHFVPLLIERVLTAAGVLAALILLMRPGGSPGEALRATAGRLLGFLVLNLLLGLAIGLGLLLLILPGVYLIARLLPATAIYAGPERPGIVDSLRLAWTETGGRVGQILFLLLGVLLVLFLIVMVLSVLGAILARLLDTPLILGLTSGALATLVALVAAALPAAVHRLLAASPSSRAEAGS